MKRLIGLSVLMSMLVVGSGCLGYRDYVRGNNRLGGEAFYYKSKLSTDLSKFNDDIGPKHVYYYE